MISYSEINQQFDYFRLKSEISSLKLENEKYKFENACLKADIRYYKDRLEFVEMKIRERI